MTDYIVSEASLASIVSSSVIAGSENPCNKLEAIAIILDSFQGVIPRLTRCGDCSHYTNELFEVNGTSVPGCKLHDSFTVSTFYCNYGTKEERDVS